MKLIRYLNTYKKSIKAYIKKEAMIIKKLHKINHQEKKNRQAQWVHDFSACEKKRKFNFAVFMIVA